MKKLILLLLLTASQFTYSQWDLRTNTQSYTSMLNDGDLLYTGHSNGLTVYDLNTKSYNYYTTLNSNLPGNYVNAFLKQDDGSILISTNRGFATMKDGVISLDQPICKSYPDSDARLIYKDQDGSLITFSSHKVHRYNAGAWTSYDITPKVRSTKNFDLMSLVFHKNLIIAIFNDTYMQSISTFYTGTADRLKLAIIEDSDVINTYEYDSEFPYTIGNMLSFTSFGESLLMKNQNGVYLWLDIIQYPKSWAKSKIFDIDSLTAYSYSNFSKDKNGNLWYMLSSKNYSIMHPAMFDVNTSKVTEYFKGEPNKKILYISLNENDEIFAMSADTLYQKTKDGWTGKSIKIIGIPDISYRTPFKMNGKSYVTMYNHSNDLKLKQDFPDNTFYCIDDSSTIKPFYYSVPYSFIQQFGISKFGKLMYGTTPNDLKYEADSAFVSPIFANALSERACTIGTCGDGNVYFNYLSNTIFGDSPYLATWQGNELIKIDMGFSGLKSTEIFAFDSYVDNLIALGKYQTGKDSMNSYLSVYNTKTKVLRKYDKSNSSMPDYWFTYKNWMRILNGIEPICLTAQNESVQWIGSDSALIRFENGASKSYGIPLLQGYHVKLNNIYFDKSSNEILSIPSNFRQTLIYFDIATEKWDSLEVAKCGINGKITCMKRLSDSKVWASDDMGYMYLYSGKGNFAVYDLQMNGRKNLNSAINDFMIDANGYLHLGTDIGLLTNKTIVGVEEEISSKSSDCISPNPASNFISIKAPAESVMAGSLIYEVYSVMGEKMLKSNSPERIDVSVLMPGVYFVKIGSRVEKFVKM